MIEVKDLNFSYNHEGIIKDFNYTFKSGKTYTLIGKSGCGKTTLLYLIDGLLSPDSGQISINGQPLLSVRTNTSLILQNYGLFPWLTLEENIRLGQSKSIDIKNTVEQLGLKELLSKYPSTLSGGQKQRGAIARSLVRHSDVLLIDEMSAALDSFTQVAIQDEVLKLHQQYNLTLLMVTHNIEEAVRMGETILIMKDGKIYKELSNPYFRIEDPRDNYDFYKLCQRVRRCLDET